jgi:uncharacterized membrane protein
MGALMDSMTDVGIDDDFLNSVREKITPGTSARFLMSAGAVIDKVHDAFQGTHAELIQTNMSTEQEPNCAKLSRTSDSSRGLIRWPISRRHGHIVRPLMPGPLTRSEPCSVNP